MNRKVDNYYRSRGITVGTYLAQDLVKRNIRALRYVAHAIKHLKHVKGVQHLLSELAHITDDSGSDQQTKITRYREYHNKLMELHGMFFVNQQLGFLIKEVESFHSKVIAPNRIGNKSCDLCACNGQNIFYFEAKDASSEITSQYEQNGFTYYEPMSEEKISIWITEKCSEAIEKGANYLCCRVPMWMSPDEDKRPGKYFRWAKTVYPDLQKIAPNEFQVSLQLEYIPSFFKGFYIIKSWGYLKFSVVPQT